MRIIFFLVFSSFVLFEPISWANAASFQDTVIHITDGDTIRVLNAAPAPIPHNDLIDLVRLHWMGEHYYAMI